MTQRTTKVCKFAMQGRALSVSRFLLLLFVCFVGTLMACSVGRAKPKGGQHIRYKACDGQLGGPNSTVGKSDMRVGPGTAIIVPPNSSGLDACFFYVGTPIGKGILKICSVGHRCVVAGEVQSVRGLIVNNPGGPAVDVLTDVIATVDITTIETEAIKGCKDKN
jgi:hypothetical protein